MELTAESPPINYLTDIYEKIYDYEELYNAYLEARKNKRYRDDVLKYTDRLEENLIQLQNELIWQTYKVGAYRPFFVFEPKKRLVMALNFKDRVAQWSVYQQLNPYYDRQFITDSYACRKGKGSHAAADRLQYWLRQTDRKPGQWYYLKLDISKYFYRVDHEILLKILRRRIKDERLMQLLAVIINSEDRAFGLPAGVAPDDCPEEEWLYDVGMPIGNLTSQLFANIYLNELDQHCKHDLHLHFYIRYMDDIIILHNDKKYLQEIKEDIEAFLRDELRLDLNNKTAIRPTRLGVEFVGYRIYATHRKLKKQTARRIIRTVTRMSKDLAAGVITHEDFMRRVSSYKGILQHCDSYGLRRKLNEAYKIHYLQDMARRRQEHREALLCYKGERNCANCRYYVVSRFCGYEEMVCTAADHRAEISDIPPDILGDCCPSFNPRIVEAKGGNSNGSS